VKSLPERLDPPCRQQVEPDGEDVDPGKAQNERRRAGHGHRHTGQRVVQPRVLPERGEDPEGDADQDGDADGRSHQRERRRDALDDLVAHRAVRLDRIAQVALDRAAEPHHVADGDRLVEPERRTTLLEALWVALELRQHLRVEPREEWVARRERERHEADDRDAEQDRERDQDASDDECAHPAASATARRPADGHLGPGTGQVGTTW